MSKAQDYIDSVDGAAHNSAVEIIIALEKKVKMHEDRQSKCETMDKAEKMALVRAFQEICEPLGLDPGQDSPCDIVKAVRGLAK